MGVLFIISCNNSNYHIPQDSAEHGKIFISVDESFKPVIDEELKVYKSSFPDAEIIPLYKPEADCFRDLQQDSVRMIIVARGLTDDEDKYYEAKLAFKARWDILAFDAVSVIVNKNAADSLFTMQKLQDLLSGKDTNMSVVVDGNNATSTVRYLLDSVLKGRSFGSNVRAAQGSRAVIDYVSNDANAIGFVGSSWVGNNEDPEQVAYSKNIKLALIECTICDKGTFAKPSQATITSTQYPLVRPLYYILKENGAGLGDGITGFMKQERGQLIFSRSYLVPAQMYLGRRTGTISQ